MQDIYFTLSEEGGSDIYQKAKATLNKYFKPQANVPYERLCFREKKSTGKRNRRTVCY